VGYACEKSVEKSSCEKRITSEKESCQKNCCKKNHNSKNEPHGCSGKCSHSGCTTSGLQFSFLAQNEFELSNDLFNFSLKKPITYYKKNSISDGFTSIWSPPKIK
jgi:hypothetical protein